jgi:hypothetical protein
MSFCRHRCLAALALALVPWTAFAAMSPAEHAYITMKQDADLFVGEGVAEVKDFDSHAGAALAAAKQKARADLAESIHVHVSSEMTDKTQAKDGQVKEEISSESKSRSDLDLEGVKYLELRDYPEAGQMTVLASLSKEDYRRQLAGKATHVYRPEYGIKLEAWGLSLNSFNTIENTGMNAPTNLPLAPGSQTNGSTSSTGNTPGIGMEFVWKDFSLGLDYFSKDMQVYLYQPGPKDYLAVTDGLSLAMVSLGWQWIPWDWRVQPFVPVGFNGAFSNFNYFQTYGLGVFAGVGLRYWPSDSFSIEISWRYLQGLNTSDYEKDGQALHLGPQQDASFSLTGQQTRAAIQWSGF